MPKSSSPLPLQPLRVAQPFGHDFRWFSGSTSSYVSTDRLLQVTVTSNAMGCRLTVDAGVFGELEAAQTLAHLLLVVLLDPDGYALRYDEFDWRVLTLRTGVGSSMVSLDFPAPVEAQPDLSGKAKRPIGRTRHPFDSDFKWKEQSTWHHWSADALVRASVLPERAGDVRLVVEHTGFQTIEQAQMVARLLLMLLVDEAGRVLDFERFDYRIVNAMGGGRLRTASEAVRKQVPEQELSPYADPTQVPLVSPQDVLDRASVQTAAKAAAAKPEPKAKKPRASKNRPIHAAAD